MAKGTEAAAHEANSVADAVATYVRKHGVRSAAAPIQLMAITLPPYDAPEETAYVEDPTTRWFDLVSQLIGIEYVDAARAESFRWITVRSIYAVGPNFLLRSYCHGRRMPRDFRIDRVRRWVEPESGQIFEAAHELLSAIDHRIEDTAPVRVARALSSLRPCLNIAVTVMRCDGVHPNEIDVIADWVQDRSAAYAALSRDELCHQIARIVPDQEAFERAVEALRRGDPSQVRDMRRLLRRLVDADFTISNEEFDLVSAIDGMN